MSQIHSIHDLDDDPLCLTLGLLRMGSSRDEGGSSSWDPATCTLVSKAFRRAYLAGLSQQASKAVTLRCGTHLGSSATLLAALTRLLAAGVCRHAAVASVDIAINSGGCPDRVATTEACTALLRALASGGALEELTLAVSPGLAAQLDRPLEYCPHLLKLNLCLDERVNDSLELEGRRLCQALSHMSLLQELRLDYRDEYGDLEVEATLDELLGSLPAASLTSLTLTRVFFNCHWEACFTKLTSLRHLALSSPLDDVAQLSTLTRLTHLTVGSYTEGPADLGALVRLEHLALGGDVLAGNQWTLLSRLTFLHLYSQQLSGMDLAIFSRLRNVRLINCGLLPSSPGLRSLAALSSLTALDLSYHVLGAADLLLPPQLAALSLRACRLPALPHAVAASVALTSLDVGDNAGLAFPADLQLFSLQRLRIDECRFIELPSAVWGLIGLTYLDVSGNRGLVLETAPHPRLGNLQALKAARMDWRAVPPSIAAQTALTSLDLTSNSGLQLVGSLSGLPRLQRLDLSSCNLRELPHGLGALTYLDLSSGLAAAEHVVSGSISSLASLRQLWLLGHARTHLPEGIKALASLTHLELELRAWDGTRYVHVPLCDEDAAWLEHVFGGQPDPPTDAVTLYRVC